MSEYYKLKEVVLPSVSQLLSRREKLHADHLDFFYGDHWNIFMDKSKDCFLEFDLGHLGSEVVTRSISQEDYDRLKTDTSLFVQISRKVL